jgi:CheY-like chemotaxis protein/two-component sensor histidine kinase
VRLQRRLSEAEKMEAIGRLAGGVAHDFNNLLTVIGGYAEILLAQEGEREELREITRAARQASALTRQLLAFSRRQVLHPRVLDLNQVIAGMEGMLRRIIGDDVAVAVRLADDLAPVEADQAQIERVILNLAANARDAMPGGGALTVESANVDLDETQVAAHGEGAPGSHVMLAVSDTGCGMDEETLQRAQEPFFTTKGVGKGTGLGLSMVHGLAEQSGGRLVLKSRPGGGTTADIWLPIAMEIAVPELRVETPVPVPRASRRLSVLVVDDDLLVLENTAAMLEDLGHSVVEARSGEEALALLRRTRTVDLVVTDYAMPGMTGLQLADAVAAERPGTVILLSTGYAELPSDTRSSLPRLSKPFDQTALAKAIEAAMRQEEPTGSIVAFRPKSA